jgi:hypothetical protein
MRQENRPLQPRSARRGYGFQRLTSRARVIQRRRSPRGNCLYFVTPADSDAAPATPNFLNINQFAVQPEWN